MSIWVNANRVAMFPEVIKVYKRAGRGQGGTEAQAKGFGMTIKRFMSEGVQALPSWIRAAPGGAPAGWQNAQVDITAIPGVPVLRATNGKRRIF